MEVNKILNSDLLDIIFEGRNKEYGAYELRKSYNRRMAKAGMITIGLLSLLVTGYIFANRFSGNKPFDMVDGVVKLTEVTVVEPIREVIIPPKLVEPPKVETIAFTVPVIVKNEFVTDDQTPPENKDLDDVRIGLMNVHGDKDDGLEPPPVVEDKRGIVVIPKSEDAADDYVFRKVEIESTYPDGATAWMRYLNRTFRYPAEAADIGLQGTVVVEFIVDADGNVSNVTVIGGPTSGGLREEAIRVIKKSGKWEPAIQNGRKVKSYKKQPISFKLALE